MFLFFICLKWEIEILKTYIDGMSGSRDVQKKNNNMEAMFQSLKKSVGVSFEFFVSFGKFVKFRYAARKVCQIYLCHFGLSRARLSEAQVWA